MSIQSLFAIWPLSQSTSHLYGSPISIFAKMSRTYRVLVEQLLNSHFSNLTSHP